MSRFLNQLIKNHTIHSSWVDFFSKKNVKKELDEIETKLISNYTPCDSNILRFATVDLNNVKVIIIGMDPYPQKGIATGRSFEVKENFCWCSSKLNLSLKNILKLIHKSKLGLAKEKSIDEVRKDLKNGKLNISKKPNEIFDYWEQQGVLFLNTAFTCEIGDSSKSGSHLVIWEKFFEFLLEYICKNNTNIKFFLWGKVSKYKGTLIQNGVSECNLYISNHPTQRRKGKNDFFSNKCFKDTLNIINWT